jgi:hypothetical protein
MANLESLTPGDNNRDLLDNKASKIGATNRMDRLQRLQIKDSLDQAWLQPRPSALCIAGSGLHRTEGVSR